MTLSADEQAIRMYLGRRLQAPGVVQVVSTRNWSGIQTRNLDQAVTWAMAEDRAQVEGIYCRATTLRAPLPPGKRGSAADSHALVGMWSDLDFGNAGHKTTGLPETMEEARDISRFARLPEPTREEHSGGGLYRWWEFGRPLIIGEDIDFTTARQLPIDWQKILGAGARRMGFKYGTGVSDLARVLRLPGTINRKAGRTPAMCRVVEDDGPRYTLASMLQLVSELRPKPKTSTAPKSAAKPAVTRSRAADGTVYDGPGPLEILGDHPCCGDILAHVGAAYREQYPGACSYCGADCQRWHRPGWADGCSVDGIAVHKGGYAVTVRTDNFPGFPNDFVGRVLSPGRLFAALHHGGDQSAAASDILRAAHGNPAATPAALALPEQILAEVRAAAAERPKPSPQAAPRRPVTRGSVGVVLTGLVRSVLDAPADRRRSRLQWAAGKALEHARNFGLDAAKVERALIRAGTEAGLTEAEAQRTVAFARGAITNGAAG